VIDAALEASFLAAVSTAPGTASGSSAALGERRSKVVLGTKFGQDASVLAPAARAITCAVRSASLGRLGTDVIDLYTYHRPDGVTPSRRPSRR
jgi:aryl-alcohol dehydrogenase-like predicted oxidoreductase